MVDSETSGRAVGEADAQSEETIMPWIWGAVGLVLIAAFVSWVMFAAPHEHHIREPAGVAPVFHPAAQHD
jgi:hypothetical protein